VVNGFVAGWLYVLLALGLTLVLSIMGIVQFAHGEIYMLGAYGAYYFCVAAGLNFFLALFISAFLVGLLGIILERFLFRPFRGQVERAIIIALALILILQTAAVIGFGGTDIAIPSPFPGVLTIWGFIIARQRLVSISFGIALVIALIVFIRRTKIGQAMVAISQDREVAALQGINIDRISATGMFLGCALAAVAGSLVGSIMSVDPFMGSFALMKGIAVIVLGGMGSIPGAIVGGLILGFIDGFVPPLLSVAMADIIGFAFIILILLLRPQGIFGHE
jgi:branched-chain amino acid transport system permease protein